jgi:hypothetical protein
MLMALQGNTLSNGPESLLPLLVMANDGKTGNLFGDSDDSLLLTMMALQGNGFGLGGSVTDSLLPLVLLSDKQKGDTGLLGGDDNLLLLMALSGGNFGGLSGLF